jgi:hypothetical protein
MLKTEPIQSLEDIAQILVRRRMVAPAIFFLECFKPVTGIARELYAATEGVQRALFGAELVPVLGDLLSSSERVEELIVILEKASSKASSGDQQMRGVHKQEVSPS